MPDERASKYEDPLDEFLKAKGIGEVTGGGTMQSESGEILWVGVDIELINLENNLALLVNEFRELGAPRGSFLQYTFKGVPQKTVTKIFVGKPYERRRRRFLGLSLVDHLIWHCGPIDILVISGEGDTAPVVQPKGPKSRRRLRKYLLAACGVGLCTGLGFILFPYLALTNRAMIYLVTVVIIASFLTQGPAIFSSIFGVAAFAFFFVPEYYSFAVANTEYAITLAVMLLVSILVSGLTARIRHQARVSRQQERQTAALFEMSQNLTAMANLEELPKVASEQISRICAAGRVGIVHDEGEGLRPGRWFAPCKRGG